MNIYLDEVYKRFDRTSPLLQLQGQEEHEVALQGRQ